MENNKYTDSQIEMQDAFGIYLEKCATIEGDVKPYYDLAPLDECLTDIYEDDTKVYDLTRTAEFDEAMTYLAENGQYKQLIADIPAYMEVLKTYRDFLVAYKYSQVLSKGSNDTSAGNVVSKNIIVFGAPGTGKSYYISHNYPGMSDENTTRTTFHPDTDYSTFVGCYKPTKDAAGELTYEFVPQSFVQAYVNAWLRPDYERYYLCIEEINRGNCAQIFGDIFQLLDRETDGMSSYQITPDRDLQIYLKEAFKDAPDTLKLPEEIKSGIKMRLPKNLWILATMNTSDQSLFPIDSAFKRRWEWKYVPIRDEKKDFVIDINGSLYNWWTFLTKVNEKIAKLTQSEDKQLGYWFVKVGDSGRISAETFVDKVLFYLWTDVFKDYANDGSSPFSYKIGKETHKLSFRSFFRLNGSLDYQTINNFMQQGLTVVPFDDDDEADALEASQQGAQTGDNSSKRSSKKYIRVTFPDGNVYDDKNASQILQDVVERVGVERVRDLGIRLSDCPLIAINVEEEIKDVAAYRKTALNHQLSNGMYLFTTCSNPVKAELLQRISRETNEDFKVEIYTQEDNAE